MIEKQIYEHVISLGWFCSVSMELERIGLRGSSGPFDWLISSWEGVEYCIENNFKGLFDETDIIQYDFDPNIYTNKNLNFDFYHDFTHKQSFWEQKYNVQEKYQRRIERFFNNIKEPTLFLRYIKDEYELRYLEINLNKFIDLLKSYNINNNILFIANHNLLSDKIKIFYVEQDVNDTVARAFLTKNQELYDYLISEMYDSSKRNNNLQVFIRKSNQSKRRKYLNALHIGLNKFRLK